MRVSKLLKYFGFLFCLSFLFNITMNSCSIKEDRIECPCYLSLDFSDVDSSTINNILIWFTDSNNNIIKSDSINKHSFSKSYKTTVKRGITNIYCWSNYNDMLSYKSNQITKYDDPIIPSFIVNDKKAMDNIYSCIKQIDTNTESMNVNINMKKTFLSFRVKIIGLKDIKPNYKLMIVSGSKGYSFNGEILQSTYKYFPKGIRVNSIYNLWDTYHFLVPLQEDAKQLNLAMINNNKKTTIFPLGEKLESCGIDLKKSYRDDIVITIDFSSLNVDVNITNWCSVSYKTAIFI